MISVQLLGVLECLENLQNSGSRREVAMVGHLGSRVLDSSTTVTTTTDTLQFKGKIKHIFQKMRAKQSLRNIANDNEVNCSWGISDLWVKAAPNYILKSATTEISYSWVFLYLQKPNSQNIFQQLTKIHASEIMSKVYSHCITVSQ